MYMSRNVKAFLAGVAALIVFGAFSGYGYVVQHEHVAVILAIIVGILLAVLDWTIRKPGRTPNKKLMGVAYVLGILGGPFVHLVWGERVQLSIIVYLSSLCLPSVVYILLLTLVLARRRPGYWGR